MVHLLFLCVCSFCAGGGLSSILQVCHTCSLHSCWSSTPAEKGKKCIWSPVLPVHTFPADIECRNTHDSHCVNGSCFVKFSSTTGSVFRFFSCFNNCCMYCHGIWYGYYGAPMNLHDFGDLNFHLASLWSGHHFKSDKYKNNLPSASAALFV